MILNSKNNNFVVRFPKNFFYPSIVKKYTTYLKRLPIPYESVADYMSASIQAVSFPALTAETVEQTLYEEPVTAKGGKRFERYLTREISMTLKSYEGWINYWILFDQMFAYYDLDSTEKYLPDLTLSFLDHTGFEFVSINFQQIVMKGISELELNYASNTAEFRNFSVSFTYNYISILKRLQ
jgi:hypothetical protein